MTRNQEKQAQHLSMFSTECGVDSLETADALRGGIASFWEQEGCGERMPQHLDGDLESLNSNRILSIQLVQIQTEQSLGTTALRHLAKTNENTRQGRNIQGSIVFQFNSGLIQLTADSPLRETKAGTEADTMEELYLLACSLLAQLCS